MPDVSKWNWAGIIAVAALLVSVPRFIEIVLKLDSIGLGYVEIPLLTITGWGTGMVFSGGQLFIAHRIPKLEDGMGKNIITFAWIFTLFACVAIISPLFVSNIGKQEDLANALPEVWQRWVWSIILIGSVEVIAAGVMYASRLPEKGKGKASSKPSTAKIEESALGSATSTENEATSVEAKKIKARVLAAQGYTQAQIGDALGVSRQRVGQLLKEEVEV